ncbi:MAG: hypothetical protein Q4P16_06745 [Spirochaetales bacterium]|nr:hypothetical protein [Spirochaetales bacterium]
MQSITELKNLENITNEVFVYANTYNDFLSQKKINTVQNTIEEIKESFLVDYSKPLVMTEIEKANLFGMITDFIINKKNIFNSHYIQLLAWHIHELKILPVKKRGIVHNVSFLEYSPNPLIPITATNRIFSLFLSRRIAPEKVSTALLLNYLNHYETASSRFKNVLKSYLKRIRYSKNVNLYFNYRDIIFNIKNNIPISCYEKLKQLGISENLLQTKYFKDVMKKYEDKNL